MSAKSNTVEATSKTAVEADKSKLATEAGKSAVELAATPPAEGVTTPVEAKPVEGQKADHAAFISAFGDKGARWFLEGKTFHASATEFITSMKTEHEAAVTQLKAAHKTETDALTAKVTELTGRLDGLKLGNDPVSFQSAKGTGAKADDGTAAPANQFTGKLPDNLAKVAAATKMPGQNE